MAVPSAVAYSTLVVRTLSAERPTSRVAVVDPLGLAITVVPVIEIAGGEFGFSIVPRAWLVRSGRPWGGKVDGKGPGTVVERRGVDRHRDVLLGLVGCEGQRGGGDGNVVDPGHGGAVGGGVQ